MKIGGREVAVWEMEEDLRKLRGGEEEPLDSTAVLLSMRLIFRKTFGPAFGDDKSSGISREDVSL